MKYLYIALILILGGVIIYLLLQDHEPIRNDNVAQVLKAKLDSATHLQRAVISKHKEDSQIFIVKEKAYQQEITRLKSKAVIQKSKPEVIKVIQDNPETAEYITLLDSIVYTQDVRIDSLRGSVTAQWMEFNKILEVSDLKSKSELDLNQHILSIEQAENKRLKRQNKFLKVGIVAIPLAVVALVLVK